MMITDQELGIYTNPSFINPEIARILNDPDPDEEAFELDALTSAISTAEKQFTMIEVGAGYGRWIVRAAKLLVKINPLPYHMVVVEADTTHMKWLQQHCISNGINLNQVTRYPYAVTPHGFPACFSNHDPTTYGQSIIRFGGRIVRGISLGSIISNIDQVIDLIDIDIQGDEYRVIAPWMDKITKRVKRVFIGTHGAEIERDLIVLFCKKGWHLIEFYRCGSTNETRYGTIKFTDGVQVWANPKLLCEADMYGA